MGGRRRRFPTRTTRLCTPFKILVGSSPFDAYPTSPRHPRTCRTSQQSRTRGSQHSSQTRRFNLPLSPGRIFHPRTSRSSSIGSTGCLSTLVRVLIHLHFFLLGLSLYRLHRLSIDEHRRRFDFVVLRPSRHFSFTNDGRQIGGHLLY